MAQLGLFLAQQDEVSLVLMDVAESVLQDEVPLVLMDVAESVLQDEVSLVLMDGKQRSYSYTIVLFAV